MPSGRPSARVFASLGASLDGYIASADGDLAWLKDSMRRDEDYGLSETMARAGAFIVGANTFRETAGLTRGARGTSPPRRTSSRARRPRTRRQASRSTPATCVRS